MVAPYGVRGGAGGALRTAPVGGALRPYAYGARGGALRRPRGCLTLTAPVGAPQVEECRILFLFSGYSLSLSLSIFRRVVPLQLRDRGLKQHQTLRFRLGSRGGKHYRVSSC